MSGVSEKGPNKECKEAADAALAAVEPFNSLSDIGHALAQVMTGWIPFDRFNIGLIDPVEHSFHDAFVIGRNVPGRATGHQRTLHGSVVEAAMQAGQGYYYGSANRQCWIDRFPGFGAVFDSGICAMLAVPLRADHEVRASLVFASCDPVAYTPSSLAVAIAVGQAVNDKILASN